MYEFYRKHDKPAIMQKIGMADFRDIEFWKYVVRQIPPLIRKLAEYYQIPTPRYPIISVEFLENKWEEWRLVSGRKNSLDRFVGGTYAFQTNRIELNPYIYLFEGREVFLGVLYHELVHWIIQHVEYLNEIETDKAGNSVYHRADFWMVHYDIYDKSLLSKNGWANYRWNKENEVIRNRNRRVLDFISIFNTCGYNEKYDGSYFPVGGNFCTGFCVDL